MYTASAQTTTTTAKTGENTTAPQASLLSAGFTMQVSRTKNLGYYPYAVQHPKQV